MDASKTKLKLFVIDLRNPPTNEDDDILGHPSIWRHLQSLLQLRITLCPPEGLVLFPNLLLGHFWLLGRPTSPLKVGVLHVRVVKGPWKVGVSQGLGCQQQQEQPHPCLEERGTRLSHIYLFSLNPKLNFHHLHSTNQQE